MSYLFDDASSNRLSKASVIGMFSISIWFYPDDSAADCTLYSEHNGAATRYYKLTILGASSDKVEFKMADAGGHPSPATTSTGTVNYNAWNHIYAARGVASPTRVYISLNGETLVDGGAGSYLAPGATTGTAIGVTGTTTRSNYMSGRIAEVGIWDNCLNDFDDRYTALSKGFDPRLIAPGGDPTLGLGPLNLISYTPLIGTLGDWVVGDTWTATSSPTGNQDHCRVHRNLLG